MQVMITARTLEGFNQKVNGLLQSGFCVIQGTSYANSLASNEHYPAEEGAQLFSIALNHPDKGQVLITAPERYAFDEEVRTHLDGGYQVIPGTMYAAYTGEDDSTRSIEHFYSVFLWRD